MPFLYPGFAVLFFSCVIGYIVKQRWHTILLLDVDSAPHRKEEKKKDEYIKKRLDVHAALSKETLYGVIVAPIGHRFAQIQHRFRRYVGKVERELFLGEKSEPETVVVEPVSDSAVISEDKQTVHDVLREAQNAASLGNTEGAERGFLSVIARDEKNVDAYIGLGNVYASTGQMNEAKETYQFVLQLEPGSDSVRVKLGDIFDAEGDTTEAISQYQEAILANPHLSSRFARLAELLQKEGEFSTALEAIAQAVDLEPENESYLDSFVEIAILSRDKEIAKEALQRLRMVDPEYTKLDLFRDRIDKLS